MDTKSVALIAMCFFLRLQAASAQTMPPLKEIETASRKLLLLAAAATGPVEPAAHDGATEHWRPSPGDSFLPRLLMVTVLSLCVIVAGVLCRRRSQNPDIQSAELAGAEIMRPNITYNFIGSCFSVN